MKCKFEVDSDANIAQLSICRGVHVMLAKRVIVLKQINRYCERVIIEVGDLHLGICIAQSV